ncbi:MAG: preprotein translocase subunit YidC [Candidatus Berkelbacteria bacterium Licking1014_7]|uniref:Preprotein translocase subunit YidC n=1 Tax=Candidatus Berkelbacteria bacterium Licking1014_7 TaxID=2017147 RepID=A0A554LJ50_9BACT|nr:MAG: preprotein translocase subunit YidC [Candidatus Berkelbacteria bacterium Licking1014_7]
MPGQSLGWAIVILTILVRLALLPSTNSATRAQKKMKELQPEIQKIKEEHKDNPALQGQKTMEIYRQYKINPLSSCLPVLAQIPVMFILYFIFREIGKEGHRFDLLYSWAPVPTHLNMYFLGIDLGKPEMWVLPILAGITQFISVWQMQPIIEKDKKMDAMATMTRQMMFIFPIMTILISRSLPSALPLYWVVSTIFTIIQQKIILKKRTNTEQIVGVNVGVDLDKNLGKTDKIVQTVEKKRGIEVTVRKRE